MNKPSLKALLMEKSSEAKRDKFHASFLLQKEEILDSLSEGWSVRFIWKTLTDAQRITMSYQTFLRLVRAAKGKTDVKNSPSPSKIGSFTVDSTPNKKELY